MTRMLYHNDPDWYEKPGGTVEIPLGAGLTRSKAFVVPRMPWLTDRTDSTDSLVDVDDDGDSVVSDVGVRRTPRASSPSR